ncbi:hypothetical protein NDU88_000110 [Pleurodeles waltl]|uniref:Secreted protein n=1 Tax=Pleurodeles waltl TaxID=8319 RepID=A0AAV7N718_PLEWA|nr:hypothetical protein NDU88_000110 [Pleurodeles waltl]
MPARQCSQQKCYRPAAAWLVVVQSLTIAEGLLTAAARQEEGKATAVEEEAQEWERYSKSRSVAGLHSPGGWEEGEHPACDIFIVSQQ